MAGLATPLAFPLGGDGDCYKAKLIRRSIARPPFDTRLGSVLSLVIAPIGESDNAIGGLYGADDPLPDEEYIDGD